MHKEYSKFFLNKKRLWPHYLILLLIGEIQHNPEKIKGSSGFPTEVGSYWDSPPSIHCIYHHDCKKTYYVSSFKCRTVRLKFHKPLCM